MAPENLYHLEIVGWDDFLHPDTRRKCKPPFRWCKLNTEFLDTHGDLSNREFGAFCRLLMLAAATNNRVVYNLNWIRRRTGASRQVIETLSDRGLVRLVGSEDETEKTQDNQATSSVDTSDMQAGIQQTARVEEKGKGFDRNGIEGNGPAGITPNRRQPKFEELTLACAEAGVSGSDWNAIANLIETKFQFSPTEKQLNTIQRQLNDRAGK